MKKEIACGAVALLREKTGQNGDYLTASCSALAAITPALVNDTNAFVKEVRRVEGLPEQLMAGLRAPARSKYRVLIQDPGAVQPSKQAAADRQTRVGPPRRRGRGSEAPATRSARSPQLRSGQAAGGETRR